MNSEESKPNLSQESSFGRLYLIGVVVVLCAIVAYFGLHTTISVSDASGVESSRSELTAAAPSPLSLAYAIALWVLIPAIILLQLLRRSPRRPQILVEGKKRIPIVRAKNSKRE